MWGGDQAIKNWTKNMRLRETRMIHVFLLFSLFHKDVKIVMD